MNGCETKIFGASFLRVFLRSNVSAPRHSAKGCSLVFDSKSPRRSAAEPQPNPSAFVSQAHSRKARAEALRAQRRNFWGEQFGGSFQSLHRSFSAPLASLREVLKPSEPNGAASIGQNVLSVKRRHAATGFTVKIPQRNSSKNPLKTT